MFPVGETFLEVVSPAQPGTTAGRLLDKRKGDGGYMVILQVDDMAAARAKVRAAGARIVDQADLDGVAMTHIHPKDVGGAILSLDYMDPWNRWEWGGPHWREKARTDSSVAIVGAELQSGDPAAMSARWVEVLGRSADPDGRIALEEGEIRFAPDRDGRGDGVAGFVVAVRDPEAVRARAKARECVDAEGEVVLSGAKVRLVRA